MVLKSTFLVEFRVSIKTDVNFVSFKKDTLHLSTGCNLHVISASEIAKCCQLEVQNFILYSCQVKVELT